MIRLARFLAVLVPALALPAAARADCPEVPGADALVVPGRVVMLGEMHGTEESPAFVAALACRAVEKGLPLRVGLEIDIEEAPALETFLGSDGTAADRDALLAGAFWTRAYQDGRSSRAMASLLDSLRALRRGGADVTVFPFSHEDAGTGRDAAMAGTIGEHIGRDDPPGVTLTLSGNLHSRTAQGSPWDPSFESMAYRLALARPGLDIVSLDVCHRGGEARFCTGAEPASCIARPLRETTEDSSARGVRLGAAAGAEGHDGVYCVGTLHASPPAVASDGDAG